MGSATKHNGLHVDIDCRERYMWCYMKALEGESVGGSQRSLRSRSASGDISPRSAAPAASAAASAAPASNQPGSSGTNNNTISRRTSASTLEDFDAASEKSAAAAATSVSAAGNASEAGGNDDERSSTRSSRNPRAGPRSLASGPSEAGSVDAASLATERGSEAVLGDIEEAAPLSVGAAEVDDSTAAEGLPHKTEEQDNSWPGSSKNDGGHRGDQQTAGQASAAHERSAPAAMQHASADQPAEERGYEASSTSKAKDRGRQTLPAEGSSAVRDPLRYLAKTPIDHPAAGQADASEAAVPVHMDEEAAKRDGPLEEASSQEPCTPSNGDVGHLPIARTTPERRLSSHSDPGHMTAELSPSQVCHACDARRCSCLFIALWQQATGLNQRQYPLHLINQCSSSA